MDLVQRALCDARPEGEGAEMEKKGFKWDKLHVRLQTTLDVLKTWHLQKIDTDSTTANPTTISDSTTPNPTTTSLMDPPGHAEPATAITVVQ